MTTYFVSRHAGAIEWANQEGFRVDKQLNHFDPQLIKTGDTVFGTLPINLVAELNQRGAHYFHLLLDLPPEARGKELTADDMRRYGAHLLEYSAIQSSK
jgi:CRISPR-associated protein Csx16